MSQWLSNERRFKKPITAARTVSEWGAIKRGIAPSTEFPVTHPIKIQSCRHQRSIVLSSIVANQKRLSISHQNRHQSKSDGRQRKNFLFVSVVFIHWLGLIRRVVRQRTAGIDSLLTAFVFLLVPISALGLVGNFLPQSLHWKSVLPPPTSPPTSLARR